MIAVQNIIDTEKSLLTIIFDKSVLNHLKCKTDDYLIIFQSNFKFNYFMMIKADTGYRIKRYTALKGMYQINVGFKFNSIPEFDLKKCDYFRKKNNSIRIMLEI